MSDHKHIWNTYWILELGFKDESKVRENLVFIARIWTGYIPNRHVTATQICSVAYLLRVSTYIISQGFFSGVADNSFEIVSIS
jgi:hypothetical protein